MELLMLSRMEGLPVPKTFKIGEIVLHNFVARDIDGARDEVLTFIQRRTNNGTTVYFDGWRGLGKVAILRSVVQVLQSMKDPPPKLYFGRIMYIDCSIWKSKRDMQRRIADELKLDHETMALFDKQDEEDDFNGVDPSSRDAIRDVAAVIDRTLKNSNFIMIFLNGSDQEVALSTLGVPEYHDYIIIWIFKEKFPSKGFLHDYPFDIPKTLRSKLRYTNIVIFGFWNADFGDGLSNSEIINLVREEADSILTRHPYMRDDDRGIIIKCYIYRLFLHHSFYEGAARHWIAQGSKYWICDEIIEGVRTREICEALCQEVSFEPDNASYYSIIEETMMQEPDFSFMVFNSSDDPLKIDVNMPCRWISVIRNNKIIDDNVTKGMLARASTIIILFESTNHPQGLPNDLMEQCNNLRVLILSHCSFNFLEPLFCYCHTLRFLGLDHCRNNYTAQLLEREDHIMKWACMNSLWVLDMRYTDWDELLYDNLDVISNIIELNIEGSMCWEYTNQLEGRLSYLERLRIVNPQRQVDTSIRIADNSFTGKTKLEVLDLSGNKDMQKLPTSLSKASNLQALILDGCTGLESIHLSNSLIKSFSYDGYGPASSRASMDELPRGTSRPKCPPNAANNENDVKTSMIILEGCRQLKNLFLHGLPNLVKLDLSGCAIKILDFQTMVVDVPRLKQLFLLGCEHIRGIKWGPYTYTDETTYPYTNETTEMTINLELLCIDTQPTFGAHEHTRVSIAQRPNESFGLQVHLNTADARLARSLLPPIYAHEKGVFFDIRIASSNIVSDEKCIEVHHIVASSLYNDVFIKIHDSFLDPVRAFPQPPTTQLDCHIEIGNGSCNVDSEVDHSIGGSLITLMNRYVQTLHVHDTCTTIAIPSTIQFNEIKWCRVERCPRLDPVFPSRDDPCSLKTIWASELLRACCIWSKGRPFLFQSSAFDKLQHLHLRSCPSLRFALPVWTSSFPKLKTLHIVHCGSLRHVFVLDHKEYNISSNILFPELSTIHLHDVPALHQICETKRMVAPKLETLRTRGCWNLRRLPALEPKACGQSTRPVVEMEKDVWEALEWDGVDAGHHPSLYQAPLQSRHYKGRRLLRGTVLR